jgi:hypothetical protein
MRSFYLILVSASIRIGSRALSRYLKRFIARRIKVRIINQDE